MSSLETQQDRDDREKHRKLRMEGHNYSLSADDIDPNFARVVLGQPLEKEEKNPDMVDKIEEIRSKLNSIQFEYGHGDKAWSSAGVDALFLTFSRLLSGDTRSGQVLFESSKRIVDAERAKLGRPIEPTKLDILSKE